MAELFSGSDGQQRFTRRVFARRVGGAVLSAPFLSLLDGITLARPTVAKSAPLEQHVVPGARHTSDNGVEIVVPPLYHEIVTARLTTASGRAAARRARRAPARSPAHRKGTRRRAERPARDRRVGPAVLPQPSASPEGRTALPRLPADRPRVLPPPPLPGAGAGRRRPLPERPGDDRPGEQRRRRAPAWRRSLDTSRRRGSGYSHA